MMYCAVCDSAMLERTVQGHEVLLCPSCGAIFVHIAGGRYSYVGTTHGSQQLRELLTAIDMHDKEASVNA